jgi:uncharacterized membrane protein HdeD (DUF308 family)
MSAFSRHGDGFDSPGRGNDTPDADPPRRGWPAAAGGRENSSPPGTVLDSERGVLVPPRAIPVLGANGLFPWWQPLGQGVLAVAFGGAVAGWSNPGPEAISFLLGLWLVGAGSLRLAGAAFGAAGRSQGEAVFSALLGVVFVVSGVLCLRDPASSVILMVVVMSLAWLLTGFGDLAVGLSGQHPGRAWMSLSGVVAVSAGVGFLLLPDLLLAILVTAAVTSGIAVGLVQVAAAFGVQRASRAFLLRRGATEDPLDLHRPQQV